MSAIEKRGGISLKVDGPPPTEPPPKPADAATSARFIRCESVSPAIVACQCEKAIGHCGDHINTTYGVFWPFPG